MAAIFKMASKMLIFFTQYFEKGYLSIFVFVKIRFSWKNFFLANSKWRNNLASLMVFFQNFQDFFIVHGGSFLQKKTRFPESGKSRFDIEKKHSIAFNKMNL
jgi:hypothetical protein